MTEPHYHYAYPHGRPCYAPCKGPVIPMLDDMRCDNSLPCQHCHPISRRNASYAALENND